MAWQDATAEPLIAMEDELRSLQQVALSIDEDSDIEELGRRLDALEMQISKTAAKTPEGLAVKIRRLWENFGHDPEEWDINNYQTLIDSLARLQSDMDHSASA